MLVVLLSQDGKENAVKFTSPHNLIHQTASIKIRQNYICVKLNLYVWPRKIKLGKGIPH